LVATGALVLTNVLDVEPLPAWTGALVLINDPCPESLLEPSEPLLPALTGALVLIKEP
jgi:hypothetical protein